jgi:hypothetical protein
LNRLDFFRRPEITFTILKMLVILNTIENKPLQSDLSSIDDIKQQDDFVKKQSISLKKMKDLFNTIIDLSAKKKQSFESTMDGDQIKMQIYNERLMILERLES